MGTTSVPQAASTKNITMRFGSGPRLLGGLPVSASISRFSSSCSIDPIFYRATDQNDPIQMWRVPSPHLGCPRPPCATCPCLPVHPTDMCPGQLLLVPLLLFQSVVQRLQYNNSPVHTEERVRDGSSALSELHKVDSVASV